MNNWEIYKDIINLPHHVSKKHPQMSLEARSAQFAPFAALVGYDALVHETARLTDDKIEIDEEEKEIIDSQLQLVKEQISDRPKVTITYFLKDERKAGGEYVTIEANVKKIDDYKYCLYMENGLEIPIEDILKLSIH
ncbi:MAG: hypothetical protein IKN09_03465 [Clostridia bacterium]|nr:hypothetical protein [Clostridia bacterium]